MAPHSSTLAWKIPWMEKSGGLRSMGSLRVGHDWATSLSLFLSCIGEGNGNPLQCSCLENPRDGEPGGLPSMGSHRVRHDWSDLAAAEPIYNVVIVSDEQWRDSAIHIHVYYPCHPIPGRFSRPSSAVKPGSFLEFSSTLLLIFCWLPTNPWFLWLCWHKAVRLIQSSIYHRGFLSWWFFPSLLHP